MERNESPLVLRALEFFVLFFSLLNFLSWHVIGCSRENQNQTGIKPLLCFLVVIQKTLITRRGL